MEGGMQKTQANEEVYALKAGKRSASNAGISLVISKFIIIFLKRHFEN